MGNNNGLLTEREVWGLVQKTEVWYFIVQTEQARSIIGLLYEWLNWVCEHKLFARIKSAIVSFTG